MALKPSFRRPTGCTQPTEEGKQAPNVSDQTSDSADVVKDLIKGGDLQVRFEDFFDKNVKGDPNNKEDMDRMSRFRDNIEFIDGDIRMSKQNGGKIFLGNFDLTKDEDFIKLLTDLCGQGSIEIIYYQAEQDPDRIDGYRLVNPIITALLLQFTDMRLGTYDSSQFRVNFCVYEEGIFVELNNWN